MLTMKSFSTSLLALAVMAGLTLSSNAAKTSPCAGFSLAADPTTVAAGGTATLSGSVSNCSGANERLTINYVVAGPCNYYDTYSLTVTLQPGETQSASVSRVVPTCTGNYTVTGSVYSGKTFLTSASVTFTVQ